MLAGYWAIAAAVLLTAFVFGSGPVGAQTPAGKRVALLVANGNYPDANLPSPSAAKDADLLASELGHDAFDITLKKDMTKQDMEAAISAFEDKIEPGSTGLLYFNGIGIQVAHQTYLIPVNAEIWSEADVKRDGFSLDTILAEMNRRGARAKIIIVDASRRNPFERRFRAYSAGLAAVDAPDGTLVMYAAAPNKVSADGNGQVSLFMNELVKEVRTPEISAEEAMTHTRVGVSRASNGEQVPWVASSMVDPFYFGRASAAAGRAEPPRVAPRQPTRQAQAKPPVEKPVVVAKPVDKGPAPAPGTIDTRPGASFRDCPDCPEMTVLPSGAFDMGAAATPFDRPIHRVVIPRPFAIGQSEITFNDWARCVSDGGCKFTPDTQGFGGDDRPVINIGWFDAEDYVAWLSKSTGKSYRLPSEAEWEYAAHGKTATPFAWGTSVGNHMANCMDCGTNGKQTMPVKSFPPNGFGLYDMAGNAAEWVADCWNMSYRGAPNDGSAWTSGDCGQRVLRGGSFDSSAAYIKPSARFRYDADVRYWANGFRVARDIR